jgi:hypothetical protein
MPEMIEFKERVYTRDVVNFLIQCDDQCASTGDIAEHLLASWGATLRALDRLHKVKRVKEINYNIWHLE